MDTAFLTKLAEIAIRDGGEFITGRAGPDYLLATAVRIAYHADVITEAQRNRCFFSDDTVEYDNAVPVLDELTAVYADLGYHMVDDTAGGLGVHYTGGCDECAEEEE